MSDSSRSSGCALLLALAGAGCHTSEPAPSAKLRRPIPASEVALLERPVQLSVAGEPIDVGDLSGYASPALFDGDGDGRLDLFVGSGAGKVRIYHNIGSAHAPTFAAGQLLKTEGNEFQIPTLEGIGIRPQFADVDGDRKLDLVLGSLDGRPYFALGGDNSLLPPAMVRNRGGGELILGTYWDYEARQWAHRAGARFTELHAVSAVPVDWDADGDIDLVAGTSEGRLVRWTNLGKPAHAAFAEEPDEIVIPAAPDAPERRAGNATPEIADWDQDGAWDLVMGTDDGAVRWAKNIGRNGAPAFAPFQQLVAPDNEDAPGRSARNVQVDVADLNGDGRVDLLVGDDEPMPPATLERIAALKRELSSNEELVQVLNGADDQARKALDPKRLAKVEALLKEYQSLQPEMRSHGRVWLYARSPAKG
jgi:FG-GAP-like repeat